MKKILIVKTGATYPAIAAKYGDFDEMIRQQMELAEDGVWVAPVYEGADLPPQSDLAGLVITGSHAMVTQKEPWSVALTSWLRKAADVGLPILGICYGHQLLADAFGGIVDYHPKGEELGTTPIRLTPAGKKDPLLGVLPPVFLGHVAHAQTVLKLPPGAVVLAHNEFESHHSFRLKNNVWGVQFHPEFTAGATLAYIDAGEGQLHSQGLQVEALRQSVVEQDYGRELLLQFKKLIR